MDDILRELCDTVGVLGCLVMSEDGIIVARQFSDKRDPERVSALMSSLFLVVNRVTSELSLGGFRSIMLEAEQNLVFARRTLAGVLVALTVPRANPGLIRAEMALAAERLNRTADVR